MRAWAVPLVMSAAAMACTPEKKQLPATDAELQPLRAILFDPEGAQIRHAARGKNGATCGLVNGKNRLGGFVGFKPFVIEHMEAYIVEPTESDARKIPHGYGEELRKKCSPETVQAISTFFKFQTKTDADAEFMAHIKTMEADNDRRHKEACAKFAALDVDYPGC